MRTRWYVGLLALAVPLLSAPTADAATQGATATIGGPVQYLGDTSPRYLTVTGVGDERLDLITIDAPPGWTATACPTAPAGWASTRAGNRCRFTTAHSNGIAAHQVRVFRIDARAAASSQDRHGRWRSFAGVGGSNPPGELSPGEASMTSTAYALEVTRAVTQRRYVPYPIGSACPAPARSSHPPGLEALVLCVRNHSSAAATLARGHTTLDGTFFTPGPADKGTLRADAVPHGTRSVIAGYLGSLGINHTIGTERTVVLRYGTLAWQSSPVTTLPHYTVTNHAPVAEASSPTSASFSITSRDADGDDPTMTVVTPPQHGQLSGPTNGRCTASAYPDPVTCSDDYSYTPDAGYSGPDSFTFTAYDGYVTSSAATVSLTAPATS
jgi:hypothetical protein